MDSAHPTTEDLVRLLENNNLASEKGNPKYEFFVTDAPERVNNIVGEFFGEALNGNLKQITLPTL